MTNDPNPNTKTWDGVTFDVSKFVSKKRASLFDKAASAIAALSDDERKALGITS